MLDLGLSETYLLIIRYTWKTTALSWSSPPWPPSWRSLIVEENVDLKYTGAVLKGPFSRNDYRGTRTMGYPPSFLSRPSSLPRPSMSATRTRLATFHQPRARFGWLCGDGDRPPFPLFGVWKT
jgi:oligosaccharyltransferase complex subunit alpha (ribophorin I)